MTFCLCPLIFPYSYTCIIQSLVNNTMRKLQAQRKSQNWSFKELNRVLTYGYKLGLSCQKIIVFFKNSSLKGVHADGEMKDWKKLMFSQVENALRHWSLNRTSVFQCLNLLSVLESLLQNQLFCCWQWHMYLVHLLICIYRYLNKLSYGTNDRLHWTSL